jgi:hypothetical protein
MWEQEETKRRAFVAETSQALLHGRGSDFGGGLGNSMSKRLAWVKGKRGWLAASLVQRIRRIK